VFCSLFPHSALPPYLELTSQSLAVAMPYCLFPLSCQLRIASWIFLEGGGDFRNPPFPPFSSHPLLSPPSPPVPPRVPSPPVLSLPLPFLRSRPLKSSYEVWGRCKLPHAAGSKAEPRLQPKSNLVHFSCKI